MSLPVNLSQRELNKFRDSSGVAIAVVNPDGSVVASSGNATVAIGSAATLYAVVNTGASSANVTLNPSPNFIGLVSTASINGRVELVAGTAYIGLATVTVGNLINSVVTQSGNVTVMQGTTPWVVGTSSLPTVTIGNIVAVSQSGTWDEVGINDSGNSITTDWTSGATVAVSNLPSIPSGNNFIGLVSVASINGQVAITNISNGATVYQGTRPWEISTSSLPTVSIGNSVTVQSTNLDIRDLTSVSDSVSVVQSGTWDEVGINDSGNSITVDWTSGATVAVSNLPALPSGSNFIGLVSAASIHGTVAISNISNGVTVYQGTNPWNSLGTTTIGSMLPTGTNFIGLATVVQGNQPALIASSAFIGLVSTASIHGNVDLKSSRTWNISPIALNTSNLSGATIFVASSSKKFYITNVIISAASNVGITFISGGTYLTGNASLRMQLAPQSGLIENNNPSAPLYSGLANQTNFLIAQDTAAPLSGRITWYEE